MKKSTLFFKVMVLLALLVPWTAWGQTDLRTFGGHRPDGDWKKNQRGTLTLTIDGGGNITDADYQSGRGGISVTTCAVDQAGKLTLTLSDWKFDVSNNESDHNPVINDEENPSLNISSYFDFVVSASNQKTLTMEKYDNLTFSDTDETFKIKVQKEGHGSYESGHILVKFEKGQTDITEDESFEVDWTATAQGTSDSKVYNGKGVDPNSLKNLLKVTYNDEPFTDFSVSFKDKADAKNVGEYTIVVTPNEGNEMNLTGSQETDLMYEIIARPVTVTLEGLELKKGANGTNLKASDYASYFKFEEENTQDKSGLVSGEKAKVTGTFDIDTQTVGDASFSTDDLDVVADNSSFASENYTIKWDGKATITKKDFSEGGEGGQGGTIIVTVVDKTYDGKPVDSPVVKDGETSLGKDAYVVEYYQGDTKLESAPIHAGEYKVVITPIETSDYDTESSITKDFTIKAAEITLTGSVTVEQGESLLGSYDIEDLDNDKVNVTYEEGSSAIEGLTLTFKAAVTPTKSGSELTQQPSDNVPNAFNVQKTEGDKDDWLITISNTETTTYKPGDITIKAITITLIVEAKKVDWTDESNQQKEVTVYVNKEGQLKYGEDGEYGNSVSVTLSSIAELEGWKFVIEDNPDDQDILVDMSGDTEVINGLSWLTIYGNEGVVTSLRISSKDKNSIYESLTESKSVKVRLEKDGADGYLLITFKQGESTEEPGGDDEDMAWAGDENKKASITVYVDKSSGQPLKSEPAMDSKGFAIDLAKFEELEGEWSFATTETNAIIDKDLSALYSFVVFEGDLLLEPQSEFNSESLSSVKVKIENGDNVGYLEINFKTITVIAEDDINKGGDDDNNNDQIDDDETTFVGDATGAKYVIYDGLPHGLGMLEITVDGEAKVLKETDGAYDVVYGESEEEPVNAGTYSATITFNEAMGYSGTVILENSVKIEKRPLNISFSFSEPIEEGKVPTLDDAEISLGETSLGKGDYLTDCIDVTFKISNEQNADKKYDVYIEHISITNSTSENNGFKPSNYDITIVCKDGVSVKMEDTNGDGVLNDNDEDFNDDSVGDIAVDDIETVDPDTGEGSTGTFYKKYELYLANKDYLKNNEETREHYASEDLELFSRHNKKTTWAGGSFTIWYEHNGEMNEGGYRIFWSNRADGDYKEVKLDEVSGYYQIRNVNSNVYVKIYYETGFPVANEEITATDARAYAQANKIVVITPEPTDVQIISMAGAVVATDQVTGQREFANLAEGVYIVRMGETVIKLQVRN